MNFALAAITVLSLALPAAASADPGNGHGNGHGHGRGEHGQARGNEDRQQDVDQSDDRGSRERETMTNGSWVPPGLAKKPHGMPPGQAKKAWAQGERLPYQYYTQPRYYVPAPAVAKLPPAPYGSRWVKVGDRYYLAQTRTGVVTEIVSSLLR